jgi:soluble lytic murein transglycosylase-like protein
MIPLKYSFFYAITLITAALFFHFNEIQAAVIKKIEPDGTITFYYSPPKKIPSSNSPNGKTNFSNEFDELIERVSAEEGIDSRLIKCIIKVESDFKPDAVSTAGAMGLMQLMKGTADIYNVSDPFDPEENVKAGVKHLKYLLKELKNDIPLALAAYHAGLGAVKKQNGIPYIKATMDYVNRVMTFYSGPPTAIINSNPVKKPIKLKIDKDGDFIFSN